MSAGFVVRADAWQRDQRPPVRRLLDLDLFEISAVPYAAYATTGIVVEQRAFDEAARLLTDDRRAQNSAALTAVEQRLAALR